ncbi:hypothetical protein ACOMHN_008016 [Nucella lapillus]
MKEPSIGAGRIHEGAKYWGRQNTRRSQVLGPAEYMKEPSIGAGRIHEGAKYWGRQNTRRSQVLGPAEYMKEPSIGADRIHEGAKNQQQAKYLQDPKNTGPQEHRTPRTQDPKNTGLDTAAWLSVPLYKQQSPDKEEGLSN